MKKRVFSLILVLAIILPIAIIFSGCFGRDVTGFTVFLNGRIYNVQTNNSVTINYGESFSITDDVVVKKIYEDDRMEAVSYSSGDIKILQGLPEVLDINSEGYDVVIQYLDYPSITFKVFVVQGYAETPNPVTIAFGDALSDHPFEATAQGQWSWNNPVDDYFLELGRTTRRATFVPADPTKYVSYACDVEINVVKRELTVPAAQNAIYNGAALTATLTNFDARFMTVSGNTQTHAGTHNITFTIKEDMRAGCVWAGETEDEPSQTATTEWTISPRIFDKPQFVSSLVYNGREQTGVLNVNNEYMTVSNASISNTNAGTYNVTVSLKNAAGHTDITWSDGSADDVTVAYSIAIKEIVIPTLAVSTEEYNGQTKTAVVQYLSDGDDFFVEAANLEFVNAGTHYVNLTLKFNSVEHTNVVWARASGASATEAKQLEYVITPISVAKPTATTAFTYDRTEKTPINNETPSTIYSLSAETANTNAGQYQITITLIDAVNYVWSDGGDAEYSIAWSISPAQVVAPTLKNSITFVYDGDEKEITAAHFNNFDNELVEFVGVRNQTNAGDYQVAIGLVDALNYVWAGETGAAATANLTFDWTIERAQLTSPNAPSQTLNATYGQTLGELVNLSLLTISPNVPGVWDWENETSATLVGDATEGSEETRIHTLKFTPTDTTNYIDFTLTVRFAVNRANISGTAPDSLSAVFGDTLFETVNLNELGQYGGLDGVWSFDDANYTQTTLVGSVGTNVFKLKFVPENANYNTKSQIEITIDVSRLELIAPKLTSASTLTYSGEEQTATIDIDTSAKFAIYAVVTGDDLAQTETGDYFKTYSITSYNTETVTNIVWALYGGGTTTDDQVISWSISAPVSESGITLLLVQGASFEIKNENDDTSFIKKGTATIGENEVDAIYAVVGGEKYALIFNTTNGNWDKYTFDLDHYTWVESVGEACDAEDFLIENFADTYALYLSDKNELEPTLIEADNQYAREGYTCYTDGVNLYYVNEYELVEIINDGSDDIAFTFSAEALDLTGEMWMLGRPYINTPTNFVYQTTADDGDGEYIIKLERDNEKVLTTIGDFETLYVINEDGKLDVCDFNGSTYMQTSSTDGFVNVLINTFFNSVYGVLDFGFAEIQVSDTECVYKDAIDEDNYTLHYIALETGLETKLEVYVDGEIDAAQTVIFTYELSTADLSAYVVGAEE